MLLFKQCFIYFCKFLSELPPVTSILIIIWQNYYFLSPLPSFLYRSLPWQKLKLNTTLLPLSIRLLIGTSILFYCSPPKYVTLNIWSLFSFIARLTPPQFYNGYPISLISSIPVLLFYIIDISRGYSVVLLMFRHSSILSIFVFNTKDYLILRYLFLFLAERNSIRL